MILLRESQLKPRKLLRAECGPIHTALISLRQTRQDRCEKKKIRRLAGRMCELNAPGMAVQASGVQCRLAAWSLNKWP